MPIDQRTIHPALSEEFLQRLTRELTDSGKLIEAGWIGLRLACFPPGGEQPGIIQLEEMRNAFFAGAQHLLSSMMNVLDPDAEPTEADMHRMDLIHKELEAFIADFVARRIPTQGQA